MIGQLKGFLLDKQPPALLIDVQGVGYELEASMSTFYNLPECGEEIILHTHMVVRDDAQLLYGFISLAERLMFRTLIKISGVGPKLALSALSGLSVRELKAAIVESDTKRLSSISGVGKKVAERLVVELRDKISKGDALEAVAGAEPLSEEEGKTRDAVMALVSLGYKQAPARKMIADALKGKELGNISVEDVIKKALGG